VVTDVGGRNGTFLNGEQIERASLGDGDRLILGSFPITVRCLAPGLVVLAEGDALPNLGTVVCRPAAARDRAPLGSRQTRPACSICSRISAGS
jgi:hypothetical protein